MLRRLELDARTFSELVENASIESRSREVLALDVLELKTHGLLAAWASDFQTLRREPEQQAPAIAADFAFGQLLRLLACGACV